MRLSEFQCTNCGSNQYVTVDRKYLFTSLRRCVTCRLMYRVPTDDLAANFRFYQHEYRQGFTTELPSNDSLEQLLTTKFEGTEKCYRYYIAILRQLGAYNANLFDYGCSWGYGSWQLVEAGYKVIGYEVSRPRARYAQEKLGVECISQISKETFQNGLLHSFDFFFSAHVLEHVPNPSHVVELARLALKPGGMFIAFTPNGSTGFRQAEPRAWHLSWGQVHPCLLDDEFYRHALRGRDVYLDASPANLDSITQFASGRPVRCRDLLGSELLCVARF
jgi:2-polyprenyl-3-methyl-5-hydroxy-6-metoxy-1,4-benzoquinol methylase